MSEKEFVLKKGWSEEELNNLEKLVDKSIKKEWIEIAKLYEEVDLEPIELFLASLLKYCFMKE